MAEELVSTVGILATSMANCNVVRADENGVVILPEFPKTVGDITLGGGGYIPGQGIVIGEGNGLVGDNAEWASNIVIGCNACVGIDGGYFSSDNIAIGNYAKAVNGYSTALGWCARTSGGCSIALGYEVCAEGVNSTALGAGARALGRNSIALGYNTTASGSSSTALGHCACATGFGALAMGYDAEAAENEIVLKSVNTTATACNVLKVSSTGVLTLNGEAVGGLDISNGIVIGEGACADGRSTNIAIGHCASASGDFSTALGACARALGDYSTALGYYVCASGDYSTAIGVEACAIDGAVIITGGAICHGAEGIGNEIVLFSQNSCQYEYCETTKECTSCECYGASSYLKVSRDGVLTVNDQEMAKKEDIISQVNTMVTNATKVDTTDSNFTLTDVANALNTLIDLLKANQQA